MAVTLPAVSVIDIPLLGVRRGSVAGRILIAITVAVPKVGGWLTRVANRTRRLVMVVGSLAAICYAGWQVAQPVGWLLIGVAGLYLEGLTSDPKDEPG